MIFKSLESPRKRFLTGFADFRQGFALFFSLCDRRFKRFRWGFASSFRATARDARKKTFLRNNLSETIKKSPVSRAEIMNVSQKKNLFSRGLLRSGCFRRRPVGTAEPAVPVPPKVVGRAVWRAGAPREAKTTAGRVEGFPSPRVPPALDAYRLPPRRRTCKPRKRHAPGGSSEGWGCLGGPGGRRGGEPRAPPIKRHRTRSAGFSDLRARLSLVIRCIFPCRPNCESRASAGHELESHHLRGEKRQNDRIRVFFLNLINRKLRLLWLCPLSAHQEQTQRHNRQKLKPQMTA